MAEPRTQADRIDPLFPWLLHWSIADERIGGFRSDSFAVQTPDGLMAIDPGPLKADLQVELQGLTGVFLTNGNHQRSTWRLRKELGARVYVPAGAAELDEEPDVWVDETTALPGGIQMMQAAGFPEACYLTLTSADGTGVLFCGDLICQDPGGPYRFPNQPGYFDPAGGKQDALGLLELPLAVLAAAHAAPSLDGCRAALQGAIDRLA